MLLLAAFYLPGYLAGDVSVRSPSSYLPVFFVGAIPQILLLLCIMSLRGRPLRDFGVRMPTAVSLLHGMLVFAGVMALFLLISAAVRLLPEHVRSSLTGSLRWTWDAPRWLIVPFALVTGYREELFYRCYLLTRIRGTGLSRAAALAAAGLLFAVGHLYQGPLAVGFAFLQALAFGALFLRFRDLHALALGHALYNAVVLFALAPAPTS